MPKPVLIIIAGPTAAGKTSLSVALARHLSTEIISADSRQFYREMQIGTARPKEEELSGITHHLLGFLSIEQAYDISQFEVDALQAARSIFEQNRFAIATGGSGLYLRTLCEGIDDMPEADETLRQQLQLRLEYEGLSGLQQELQRLDPAYFAEADIQNPRRVLRALEVCLSSGKPYSSFRSSRPKADRPFDILKIGLYREREELYQRINLRVDQMMEEGLLEEVRSLYPYRQLNALQTVGYQEFFPYLEEKYELEEAIRLLKRNSRRYAKRQMTWFRKEKDIHWINLSTEKDPLRQMIRIIQENTV
ncbi:MAG: tRNA (adenosine(37)-N6)-dimethylallyltransferase MiaA [Cyclobacteriaceae bacterium]